MIDYWLTYSSVADETVIMLEPHHGSVFVHALSARRIQDKDKYLLVCSPSWPEVEAFYLSRKLAKYDGFMIS